MTIRDDLKQLCFEENGGLKPKNECRAQMINKLILDDGMDIDEAEDITDKTIRELDLWEPKMAEIKKWLEENNNQSEA